MTQKEILDGWLQDTYALGWRGHLAKWIVRPALNEAFVREYEMKLTHNKPN